MAKAIQKQPNKTPVKRPLQPPPSQPRVFSRNITPDIPTPSVSAPIQGSVAPPTAPNLTVAPQWLGAFRPR